jgi:hypothetical protein
MIALDASATDLILIIMIVIVGTVGFYINQSLKRDIERMRLDNKAEHDKLWTEIRALQERYHRLDALNFAMAKVLEMAKTGKAKIVRESANGDGDYTLNRKY